MREIKREVQAEHCDDTPLLGVMDGAQSLWNAFQEVFKDIKNNSPFAIEKPPKLNFREVL